MVPMHNAAPFVARTLESIIAQSHADLEIVVVDDGSTDDSADIVRRFAADEPRVRLLAKENGGVAAARNYGAAATTASYIAFCDADDLWTSDKIERQLACFAAGDDRIGLVYSWFARIDADDLILGYESASIEEGDVLSAICTRNLIGNGSSVLIRRHVFDQVGGYDTKLRDLNAEGCEDYDLYARVAARWDYGLVRDFLVGYRITDGNMSSNLSRMVRSRTICANRLISRHPDRASLIRYGHRRYMRWALRRALASDNKRAAVAIAGTMLRVEPLGNLLDLPSILLRTMQPPRVPPSPDRSARPAFLVGGTDPALPGALGQHRDDTVAPRPSAAVR